MQVTYNSFIICFLCIANVVQAAGNECLNFEDALLLTSQRDPSVLSALAQQDEAEAGVKEAGSLNKPKLSAFGRTGAGDVGVVDSNIQNQVGARLSQRVIDFGDAKFARIAARYNLGASTHELRQAKITAAQESGFLYLSIMEVLERMRITQKRHDYFNWQLKAVEKALRTGGATRFDLADVAAQLADTQAFMLEQQFLLEQATTRLEINTGIASGICTSNNIDDYLISQTSDIDNADSAIALAIGQNSALQASLRRADSLKAASQRERRNGLPVLDVVGISSYTSEESSSDFDLQNRVGFDISVPLFSGGELSARRKRAAAREAAARSEALLAERQLEEDVSIVYRRIDSLTKQLKSRLVVEEQNAEQFKAAEIEYEAGTRTLPDLVDVRLDYEQASLDRIRIKSELLRQRLQLMVLTSRLPIGSNRII